MAVEIRQIGDQQLAKIVGGATLEAMKDIYIDDVIAYTDLGLETLPSYMELYRRAVRQQWQPDELDFTQDRKEWESLPSAAKKRRLWGLRLFFDGEERVAALLAPFVWAAPTREVEAVAATQLVDEVRHTVFFDRYWREVIGTSAPDIGSLVEEIRIKSRENSAYTRIFYDWLPDLAKRLAAEPKDLETAVEFTTVYHLVAEGALFLTGMRYQLEGARRWGRTWGYYQGFTAATRDESRHVLFGVRLLRDMVRQDPRRFVPVIQASIAKALPLIDTMMTPPDGDLSYYGGPHLETAWPGYTPDRLRGEMLEFAKSSLAKRLRAAGVPLMM